MAAGSGRVKGFEAVGVQEELSSLHVDPGNEHFWGDRPNIEQGVDDFLLIR